MSWVCTGCGESHDDDMVLQCWNCLACRPSIECDDSALHADENTEKYNFGVMPHIAHEDGLRARLSEMGKRIDACPAYISDMANENFLYSSVYSVHLWVLIVAAMLAIFSNWILFSGTVISCGGSPMCRFSVDIMPFGAPVMAIACFFTVRNYYLGFKLKSFIVITGSAFAFVDGTKGHIIPNSDIRGMKKKKDEIVLLLSQDFGSEKIKIDLHLVRGKDALLRILNIVTDTNEKKHL